MAARTFTDSAGLTWDVFEVHRASQRPSAVSPGFEQGWLAFACGEHKRRLAPFPSSWESATDSELETLCQSARRAGPPRFPLDHLPRPRIRRSSLDLEPQQASPVSVEATVRSFAHAARARGLSVVAAMLELKSLLQRHDADADSGKSDRQLVRRWFVEAYYFDRDSSDDQRS